ncbi:unnamed protein product [Allacma fusca]|uniref:Uncharacterized protein n=1 Tax=Allacma fusca TaxID=39272 RepID=A0A8J2LBQ0_9HEXA|nr:unnamed protein product [Allacma fusca]
MSVTKTLVHHATTTTTTTMMNNSARRFLLPSEGEDMGLVMRLDSKLEPGLRTHGGSTPVPAKLCGQTKAVATWALSTWTSQIQKVSDSIQRLLIRLLPVMLYTSLLVSLLQAGAVIYLLASSALPLGVWFLLGCLAIMCYFYLTTILSRSNGTSATSRRLSHSSSSASLSPSTSDNKFNNNNNKSEYDR